MKPSPQFVVYVLGLVPFGMFYEQVSSALGGKWLFLICGIAYLIGLRLLGVLVAKVCSVRGVGGDA